jgi:aspartate/methionine/tyrosine aminotransferase
LLDGAAFGRETAHFVRVCFATYEATIDVACERIRLFCETDLADLRSKRDAY